MLPQNILLIEALLLGLVVGSFLNVCILRIPQNQTIGGRSACPKCNKKIAWYDNIPVFSFIILMGKCRGCKTKISWQYPLVELVTAILSVATLIHFNFSILSYGLWFIFFICPLVTLSVIDMKIQIIPDSISLPGIASGIITTLILNRPAYLESLKFSGLGLLSGGGSLLLIAIVFEKLRNKEGMGGGDIKLAAMLGAFTGMKGVLFTFFVSSILALIFFILRAIFIKLTKKEDNGSDYMIPYGPFLSAASLIYLFFGENIINWYLLFLKSPHHS
ncbi:prepilin peptidase [bacterium]|nr:prepilin peptidase [bacterium]